ncbi:unnamed protein product [Heligmosomoides polygyrus]|uniref:Integrase catalytic domain-containing protein n=1 Tax=Heligmosomoides polygyrus TaxID=6339 RepID=A0A183FJU2_HELPZ|nr:unnamed protein product [Heligmosomoides polygyrus]
MGLSASGMKFVLVLVDHFSKWLGAYALPNKSAAAVATAIYQRWICEKGRWPRQLHSDLGSEFVNQAMEGLAKPAGIKRSTTKGYDSRANGVCERAIGTLQRILKKKVDRPDYWDTWLPNAVYAYNVTPHEGTGESPFFLLHGFDPYIPSEVIPEGVVTAYQLDWDDYKSELCRGMQLIRTEVKEYADRVSQQARECIDKYILPEYRTNIVDRLPGDSATVDMKAPCCELGVIADAEFVVPERQARTFYTACVQLLERWTQLETCPEEDGRMEGGLTHSGKTAYPHIREGRVVKRYVWSRQSPRQRRGVRWGPNC